MEFRLIDTGQNDGFFNMAMDETVMHFVREWEVMPTIRLYQWNPPCLSLGYFQTLSDVNLAKCREKQVSVVRRLTGGKAVFHDKELTYSIICPGSYFPKSVKESYKIISTPILETLRQLKLNVSLKNDNVVKTISPICFQESSFYEVNINGKKIVGSAQARIKNVLLQHGSILLDFDARFLCSLFNVDRFEEEVEKTGRTVTSVNNELGEDVDLGKLKSILVENFKNAFNIKLIKTELSKDELIFAKRIEWKYKNV